jgi:hypothetical protein
MPTEAVAVELRPRHAGSGECRFASFRPTKFKVQSSITNVTFVRWDGQRTVEAARRRIEPPRQPLDASNFIQGESISRT